ncbi:MAG: hypothetical protein ACYCUM_01855 [Solirubrobacteraceae bacterium]
MRGLRNVGMALAAVAALGSATASAASAHSFKASSTGELTATQVTSQWFHTAAGAIECNTLKGSGKVTALSSETQVATVEVGECTAFSMPMTFTPIEFEFNANGTVSILNTVTGEVPYYCKVTIPPQSDLGSVTYKDAAGGKLEIEASVDGITSTGKGPACNYGTESKGEYGGTTLAELLGGGSLEWS